MMSFWWLIGIAIAVALGVHFGLKIHENPDKAKDGLKILFFLACIGGIIYGIVVGIMYLIGNIKDADYPVGAAIFRIVIILYFLGALFGKKNEQEYKEGDIKQRTQEPGKESTIKKSKVKNSSSKKITKKNR